MHSNQSTVLVDRLNPCQPYWLKLTAVDCAALVRSPAQMVASLEATPSDLVVSVSTNRNSNIVVHWTSRSPTLLEQVQSIQVTVTSECPTRIVPPQTQIFTVTPDEGNSVTIMGLGITRNCSLSIMQLFI